MANKFYLLLPVLTFALGACTLEPSRFTGTDLLAPDAPKKEEVKTTLPVALKTEHAAPKPVTKTIVEPKLAAPAVPAKVPPSKPLAIVPVIPPAKPVEKKAECAVIQKTDATTAQTIKKNDRVKITVFRESDLTGMYRVDEAGYIALPMIGKTVAANQTAKILQDNIRRKLASGYLVNPDVTVEILPDCNEK